MVLGNRLEWLSWLYLLYALRERRLRHILAALNYWHLRLLGMRLLLLREHAHGSIMISFDHLLSCDNNRFRHDVPYVFFIKENFVYLLRREIWLKHVFVWSAGMKNGPAFNRLHDASHVVACDNCHLVVWASCQLAESMRTTLVSCERA